MLYISIFFFFLHRVSQGQPQGSNWSTFFSSCSLSRVQHEWKVNLCVQCARKKQDEEKKNHRYYWPPFVLRKRNYVRQNLSLNWYFQNDVLGNEISHSLLSVARLFIQQMNVLCLIKYLTCSKRMAHSSYAIEENVKDETLSCSLVYIRTETCGR